MLSRNIVPNFGIIGFRIGLYDMALGIKVGGTWGDMRPLLLSDRLH
jgi:hypothetical protein